jgi:hypothetical protein
MINRDFPPFRLPIVSGFDHGEPEHGEQGHGRLHASALERRA